MLGILHRSGLMLRAAWTVSSNIGNKVLFGKLILAIKETKNGKLSH